MLVVIKWHMISCTGTFTGGSDNWHCEYAKFTCTGMSVLARESIIRQLVVKEIIQHRTALTGKHTTSHYTIVLHARK